MFFSALEVLNFLFTHAVWVLFTAIVLWIVFVPQISKRMNRPKKTERYFVE